MFNRLLPPFTSFAAPTANSLNSTYFLIKKVHFTHFPYCFISFFSPFPSSLCLILVCSFLAVWGNGSLETGKLLLFNFLFFLHEILSSFFPHFVDFQTHFLAGFVLGCAERLSLLISLMVIASYLVLLKFNETFPLSLSHSLSLSASLLCRYQNGKI